MEFYEKLQRLRTERHLTQEQLATQLYVSRTAVSSPSIPCAPMRPFPPRQSRPAAAACYPVPWPAFPF